MERKAISTDKVAPAVGPFSAAIDTGTMVYASGQIALDPASGQLISGDLSAQTTQVLRNVEAVLAAAGLTLNDVVKTTVYLADMDDFPSMNAVYANHFTEPFPARTTIQAARLPLGARVEIEVIASRAG